MTPLEVPTGGDDGGDSRRLVCAWCRQPFTAPRRRGPVPAYCSPAHRQAAWADRAAPVDRRAVEQELPPGISLRATRGATHYVVRWSPEPGVKRQATRTFATLADAWEFLESLPRPPARRSAEGSGHLESRRLTYRDLGSDELGRLLTTYRSWLMGRGLSVETVRRYVGDVWSAGRYCADHGKTLANASGGDLGAWAGTKSADARVRGRRALAYLWAMIGRPDPPTWTDDGAPGTPAGRGRPRWLPEWQRVGGEVTERLAAVREDLLRRGLGPRTVRTYITVLWRAERYCTEAGWSLPELTADQLATYADTLANTRSTRVQTRSALVHYWRVLGHPDPPSWALRAPRGGRMVCRALEDDEARRLAKVAREDGGLRGAALLLGLYAGLRREEIATARWDRIDEDNWLHVIGKGNKEGAVPLHPVVLGALQRLERRGPFMFPGSSGPHVHPASVWNWVRALAERAEVADVTPHRLRHTCLALGNDETGDLRAVQDLARHASPDTTSGYTRSTRRRLVAVVDAVGRFLGGDGPGDGAPRSAAALMVPYAELVAGLLGDDGAGQVGPLVALGEALAGRGWSWRFSGLLGPDTITWHHPGGELWASVEAPGGDFVLWRQVGPDAEDTGWWEFATLAELLGAVEVIGAGGIPAELPRGVVLAMA